MTKSKRQENWVIVINIHTAVFSIKSNGASNIFLILRCLEEQCPEVGSKTPLIYHIPIQHYKHSFFVTTMRPSTHHSKDRLLSCTNNPTVLSNRHGHRGRTKVNWNPSGEATDCCHTKQQKAWISVAVYK